MKRTVAMVLFLLLLTGCSAKDNSMGQALTLREQLLHGNGCEFDAAITADYVDAIYTFVLHCRADRSGALNFQVTSPESISGIRGSVSQAGGNLTFDDQVLAFEMLADGMVTPVSAPWLMMHALRSGYIRACGEDTDGCTIQIDDSYKDGALQIDVRLNSSGALSRAEIYYEGRRILSVDVSNFTIL